LTEIIIGEIYEDFKGLKIYSRREDKEEYQGERQEEHVGQEDQEKVVELFANFTRLYGLKLNIFVETAVDQFNHFFTSIRGTLNST